MMLYRRLVSPAAMRRSLASYTPSQRIFSSASRPILSSFQPPPSSFSPQEDHKPPSLLQDAVDHFNVALKDHTILTFGVMIASEMTFVFGTYTLLQLSGVAISPEFALAYAASRPFRRLRMPLDLAAAAFLAKYFPELTKVKVSTLMPSLPPSSDPASSASLLQRGLSEMNTVMDKYGACYMIGSRLVGLTVVSALYAALLQGLDILPILTRYGMGDIGSAVGTWAAAVTLSSVFYPVTLGMVGYVVPVVAKLTTTKATPPNDTKV